MAKKHSGAEARGTAPKVPPAESGTIEGPSWFGAPLAGLGLALTVSAGRPPDGERLRAALRSFTAPPRLDLELRFPDLVDGGDLWPLEELYNAWLTEDFAPDAPERGSGALADQDALVWDWMLSLVPLIHLPATPSPWCAREHFSLALWRLAHGVDPRLLPDPPAGPPRQAVRHLPYRRPPARGDVTPEHLEFFGRSFPGLAAALAAKMPWEGAGTLRTAPVMEANAAAGGLLGIQVDLRAGFLATEAEVGAATGYAGGTAFHDGYGCSLSERLRRFLEFRSPVARSWRGRRDQGRAVWSCAVDKLLSSPDGWRDPVVA